MNNMFAPLSPAEIALETKAETLGTAENWTPVVPVPDDAPMTNFRHPRLGFPNSHYIYQNAFGVTLFYICQFDTEHGKQILPCSFCESSDGHREWRWKSVPTPRPLFGLAEWLMSPAATVLITEGEKTAVAAAEMFPDMVVMTSPGGAKAAGRADWRPLVDRNVVVWPDHDEPGRAYAADVVRLTLAAGAVHVAVVTVPEVFPAGWDLADPIPEGWDADRLRDLLASAEMIEGEEEAWSAPDMTLFNASRRPAPPLPLDVFGPWRPWVEAVAEGTSSPADYAACALLAGAASLIGNARGVSPWHSWKEPCALWVALVGSPSSGKSPAIDPIVGMHRQLEADLLAPYEDEIRCWRGQMEAAKCIRENWQIEVKTATKQGTPPPDMPLGAVEPDKPARPRLAVSDTTPEALTTILAGQPRGLLACRDELSGWLGSFDRYGGSGGERAFWLEAFGGRTFVLDRVKLEPPLCIPHLTLSLLGGIQPDKLVSALMRGDDDGLAARMLMTWPEPVRPARPRLVIDEAAALAAMQRLIGLTMGSDEHGSPAPVVLPLADDAADLFEGWRALHAEEAETVSGLLSSHHGKLPGLVLRLSLVLELLWWSWGRAIQPPAAVSARALARATGLVDHYFLPMAERCYGDAAMPEAERLGAVLARWILRERPEVVNARDIRRTARLPGLRDAAKTRLALDVLVEADWLRPAPSRGGSGHGRQREDYAVNPRLRGV